MTRRDNNNNNNNDDETRNNIKEHPDMTMKKATGSGSTRRRKRKGTVGTITWIAFVGVVFFLCLSVQLGSLARRKQAKVVSTDGNGGHEPMNPPPKPPLFLLPSFLQPPLPQQPSPLSGRKQHTMVFVTTKPKKKVQSYNQSKDNDGRRWSSQRDSSFSRRDGHSQEAVSVRRDKVNAPKRLQQSSIAAAAAADVDPFSTGQGSDEGDVRSDSLESSFCSSRNTTASNVVSVSNTTSTSDSASNAGAMQQNLLYIRYTIDPKARYVIDSPYADQYRCTPQAGKRVRLTETSFEAALGFATYIDTNLKILNLGDSVSMQLGAVLEEALYATPQNGQQQHPRSQQLYGRAKFPCITVASSNTSHDDGNGGVVASWRITGILQEQGRNQPGPNHRGGGWSFKQVQALLNWKLGNGRNQKIKAFHVALVRVPFFGWMLPSDVQVTNLTQSIDLLHDVFGVETVVLMTTPYANNIQNSKTYHGWIQANRIIHQAAAEYNSDSSSHNRNRRKVKHVIVLDVDAWTTQLMWRNAQDIGMLHQTYLLRKLEKFTSKKKGGAQEIVFMQRLNNGRRMFKHSIAQTCHEPVEPGSPKCLSNALSYDGMHWCMEAVGARWMAALACVLSCIYRPPFPASLDGNNNTNNSHTTLAASTLLEENQTRTCVSACHETYLNLTTVEEMLSHFKAMQRNNILPN